MGIEKRGFGSMSEERKRQIASLGGRAAQKKGTAYRWNSETAKAAGRRGGAASQAARRQPREVDVPLPFDTAVQQ